MTQYDDDERVRKRIRGRRNWPDSGAAAVPGGIWRRHRGAADFEGGTKRKYIRAGIVRHESFPGKLKGGGVHAGGLKLL